MDYPQLTPEKISSLINIYKENKAKYFNIVKTVEETTTINIITDEQ